MKKITILFCLVFLYSTNSNSFEVGQSIYLNACGSSPDQYFNTPLKLSNILVEVPNKITKLKKSKYDREFQTKASSVINLDDKKLTLNLSNFRDMTIEDDDGIFLEDRRVSGATSIYEIKHEDRVVAWGVGWHKDCREYSKQVDFTAFRLYVPYLDNGQVQIENKLISLKITQIQDSLLKVDNLIFADGIDIVGSSGVFDYHYHGVSFLEIDNTKGINFEISFEDLKKKIDINKLNPALILSILADYNQIEEIEKFTKNNFDQIYDDLNNNYWWNIWDGYLAGGNYSGSIHLNFLNQLNELSITEKKINLLYDSNTNSISGEEFKIIKKNCFNQKNYKNIFELVTYCYPWHSSWIINSITGNKSSLALFNNYSILIEEDLDSFLIVYHYSENQNFFNIPHPVEFYDYGNFEFIKRVYKNAVDGKTKLFIQPIELKIKGDYQSLMQEKYGINNVNYKFLKKDDHQIVRLKSVDPGMENLKINDEIEKYFINNDKFTMTVLADGAYVSSTFSPVTKIDDLKKLFEKNLDVFCKLLTNESIANKENREFKSDLKTLFKNENQKCEEEKIKSLQKAQNQELLFRFNDQLLSEYLTEEEVIKICDEYDNKNINIGAYDQRTYNIGRSLENYCETIRLRNKSKKDVKFTFIKDLNIKKLNFNYLSNMFYSLVISDNEITKKNSCNINLIKDKIIDYKEITDRCGVKSIVYKAESMAGIPCTKFECNLFEFELIDEDDLKNGWISIVDYFYTDINNDSYLDLVIRFKNDGRFSMQVKTLTTVITSKKKNNFINLNYIE